MRNSRNTFTASRVAGGQIDHIHEFADGTLKAHGPATNGYGTNGGVNHYPFFNGQLVNEVVWTFTDGTERRERAAYLRTRACSWYAVAKTAAGKQKGRTFAESFQPE
jgi:hypothetical protein